jgi:hypothetical protein
MCRRIAGLFHPEHLHDLVAQMIDHLDRNATPVQYRSNFRTSHHHAAIMSAASRKRRATSRKRRYRQSTTFEEACYRADAEQSRRLELEEVARLSRLSMLEYDRQREEAAKRLEVRVGTLDKAVWKQRASADNDDGALPHWKVEPSPEPVDGAAFLNIFLPKGADIALPLWVLHACDQARFH